MQGLLLAGLLLAGWLASLLPGWRAIASHWPMGCRQGMRMAPVRGFKTMSAVWVSGTLGVERGDSELGVSGYSLQAVRVEPYREK